MLLLDHFRELTDAPGAAAHLRRLILDKAIRGQLVDQNPEDEPASALLERIREERERRVRAGELKRARSQVQAISENEAPFELPAGWVWCRFAELITSSNNGISSGKNNPDGIGRPHLRPMNISPKGEIDLTVLKFTEKDSDIYLKKNDLFFNNTNSNVMVGKTTLIEEDTEWLYSNHMTRIHCFDDFIDMEYVNLYFNERFESGYFKKVCRQYINQASVNLTFLKTELLFPLPPHPEQHRIVARVETLLGQLEELDAAANRRAATADRLVPALLNGLAEADDLSVYWRERVVPNFGLFTEREAYCEQLRRLILDLAVRGRLVDQDPADEPATELLKRIRAERARRVKAGELKRGKKLQEIGEGEVPFGLPEGWVWCRFAELIVDSNNGISSGKHNTSGIGRPHLRPMNINPKGEIDLTVLKYTEKDSDISLKKNDLFFNNTNSNVMVGKTTLIEEDTEWLYSNHMTRIQCFDDLIDMQYVKLYFNELFESGYFKEVCRQYINQASVNLTFLKTELLFPLPPLPEQRRIVERVEPLLGRVEALRGEVARRGELREGVWGAVVATC